MYIYSQQMLYQYWPEENVSLNFVDFTIETQSKTKGDGFVQRNIKILQKVSFKLTPQI